VERHIKLERVDWARAAATAHHVSLLPEFRRQFAREVLRPGLTLRIARVALLFTDLTGSTELYTRVGDARAFEVVQSHFELLAKVVERHQGGIVKTIGDAVMAAFMTEENAVRAAIDMHRELAAFREQYHEDLRLKIGVHAGACYAITANGVLDYFGQTVNVAARLQGAAGGGEVVMAKGLSDAARERGWLGTDYPSEHFQAELKGLAAPLDAERLRVDASA
jgi:class 3 adenylate cyclase